MKLYYYLENDGAGAGYAMFCESRELAEIMEDFSVERTGMGWGDGTVNFIEIDGDNIVPNYDWTVTSAIEEAKEELKSWDDSEYTKDTLTRLQEL